MRVLRKSERKVRISSAMRTRTSNRLSGLSNFACWIHGKDLACPPVVGMANGTAERDHPMTLRTKPVAKTRTAR